VPIRLIFAVLVSMPLAACTFVKMGPGAERVKVAAASKDMGQCEKRGEIAVSVKDRLGPYARDELRVRDELETLARNEAPGLQADTVQPKSEPSDGEQRFLAYRCLGASPADAAQKTGAETLPLQE
jgi:hypothetical protein